MKTVNRVLSFLPCLLSITLVACGGGSEQISQATVAPTAQILVGVPLANAYSLDLQAMQDVKKNTDVYITLRPNDGATGAARSLKQVQLKSFDTAGVLRWTRNASDVPAPADGSGASTATLTYTDMSRYQPVQAQVLAQTAQTIKTQVLKTSTPVKLRPDLTVSKVQVPQQVQVGQIVNIAASVHELNGDLGATTRVSLQRGDTEIDHADAVTVAAGGITQVILATKFDQAGEYTLRIGTQNTQPRDYDDSNDSTTFTVRVVDGVQSVDYWLDYSNWKGTYSSQWNSSYGSGQFSQTGEYEWVGEGLSSWNPTAQLTFPITRATLRITVDGGQSPLDQQFTVSATGQWNSQCYSSQEGWSYNSDLVTALYVQVVDACGVPRTFVQAWQAASDLIVYSHNHDAYWGDYTYGPTLQKWGTFVHATKSVETRLVVTGSNGVSIGGTAQVQVSSEPHVASGTYSWYDGTSSWSADYLFTTGSSYGMTQP